MLSRYTSLFGGVAGKKCNRWKVDQTARSIICETHRRAQNWRNSVINVTFRRSSKLMASTHRFRTVALCQDFGIPLQAVWQQSVWLLKAVRTPL
jgi:hypothetical protein